MVYNAKLSIILYMFLSIYNVFSQMFVLFNPHRTQGRQAPHLWDNE